MTGSERGFTIIEVILFLAITGGLFAALMIGVSVGVTQQRYLDSVRSYKALLQDQYIAAVNTRNEDNKTVRCDTANDGTVETDENNTNFRSPTRGSSGCVILGRAIQLVAKPGASLAEPPTTEIITSSVTGYDPGVVTGSSNDALASYQPKLALFDQQTSTIDWGGRLTQAERQNQSDLSTAIILILRSPLSGSITVYTSDTGLNGSNDLTPLFDGSGLLNSTIIRSCVDGDSGMLPKQMIVIDPKIGGPDAVSSDGGASEVCQR